jgi:hypothetical protein
VMDRCIAETTGALGIRRPPSEARS